MMSWVKSSAAAAALLLISAQPCFAADDFRSAGAVERRSGAFAGMTVRLPMGQAAARPSARLQLTTMHHMYDGDSRLSRTVTPAGFELALSGSAKPAFYIGGRNAAEVQHKLGMKGASGTTIAFVVGGALVVVLLLAAVASAAPTPGPREGAFD